MKQVRTLLFFFPFVFIFFLFFSCSKDDINDDIKIKTRTAFTVNSFDDLQDWFQTYLSGLYDNPSLVSEAMDVFQIDWDSPIVWNDSTVVYSCAHFIPGGNFGYTRLFFSLSNDQITPYFYSIIPDDQEKMLYTDMDIDNFTGWQVIYNIEEGYTEQVYFQEGLINYYYDKTGMVDLRCPYAWCPWWAPTNTEGSTDHDNGGCSCGAQCGGINCTPPGNNGGSTIYIDITGTPTWLIINQGNLGNNSNSNQGGGGNGNSNNGGGTRPSGMQTGAIDEAGLNEIMQQQICNYFNQFVEYFECESVYPILEQCSADQSISEQEFINCVIDKLSNDYEEVDDCIAYINNFEFQDGSSLTKAQKLFLNQNVGDIPCDDIEIMNEWILENIMFVVEIDEENGIIIDLIQSFVDCFGEPDEFGNYIDCSSNNSSFNMTIYADQPNPGSRDTHSGSFFSGFDVGHTFVSLSMNDGTENSTLVFGLYPENGASPFAPETSRAMVDDGGHSFDVGLSFELSCEEFNLILIEAGTIESQNYNLNSNNCTDFGLNLGNTIGCCIPDSQGNWGVGSGSNPGDLGEDLREYEEESGDVILGPGVAPDSNCN